MDKQTDRRTDREVLVIKVPVLSFGYGTLINCHFTAIYDYEYHAKTFKLRHKVLTRVRVDNFRQVGKIYIT